MTMPYAGAADRSPISFAPKKLYLTIRNIYESGIKISVFPVVVAQHRTCPLPPPPSVYDVEHVFAQYWKTGSEAFGNMLNLAWFELNFGMHTVITRLQL